MEKLWDMIMSVWLYLALIKAALLGTVDALKYIFRADNRPYYTYLKDTDKEKFERRTKEILTKCFDHRMNLVLIKYTAKTLKHTLRCLERKAKI